MTKRIDKVFVTVHGMVKWFGITQNQYVGFFALGLALFALQQLPYMIMPFIQMETNILMEMEDRSFLLNAVEKVFGVSCVIIMIFLVRGDAKWFSIDTISEKIFFSIALMAIAVYFVAWVFYFRGFQILPFMLLTLVAMPPIYYASIGLWRGNYVLTATSGFFLAAHIANVWNNLR